MKSTNFFKIDHVKYYLSQTGWFLRHFVQVVFDPSGYIAYRRFIRKMKTAVSIFGMKGSRFRNPSGAYSFSTITPHSMTILGMAAVKNEEILKMWSCEALNLKIQGKESRIIKIGYSRKMRTCPVFGPWSMVYLCHQ